VQVWFLKHLLLSQFIQTWKPNKGKEYALKALMIDINSLAKIKIGR